jgi:DNA-directed RNA polymerase specialized sigma24 family protein
MADREIGSVSQKIDELKAGDGSAADLLWERYFDKLVHRARVKMARMGASRVTEDEEDVAISAFRAFCRKAQEGKFPDIDNRDALWRLLVRMTLNKAVDLHRREKRQKRAGGRAPARAARGCEESDAQDLLDRISGDGPSPELEAMMAEMYHSLLEALDEEDLRQIAVRKLEGYTNEEIAVQLGCSLRKVVYRLKVIRETWEQSP